jgi:hypothetical protein
MPAVGTNGPRNSIPGECRLNPGKEFVVVHRLNEKSSGAALHCLGPDRRIILAGQDDYPARRRNSSKSLLYLQAIHGRHQDVEHDNFRLARLSMAKELDRIRKRIDLPTRRRKQPAGRLHYRCVIIKQANRARFYLNSRSQSQILHLRDLTRTKRNKLRLSSDILLCD